MQVPMQWCHYFLQLNCNWHSLLQPTLTTFVLLVNIYSIVIIFFLFFVVLFEENWIWCMILIIQTQEGHDGPVLLHWLICKIFSYQALQYFGIGLKYKTPKKD